MSAVPESRWRRREDRLLAAVLGLMCAIPVVELILRATIHRGILGASSIVQNLVLVIGMLGSAVAARECRLLTISAVTVVLPGRVREWTTAFANTLAAAVCAMLFAAEAAFVLAERHSGAKLLPGVPLWWVQALMPLGFLLVGWRLFARIAHSSAARLAGVVAGAALGALAWNVEIITPTWFAAGVTLILLGAVLGTPLFAVLAGTTLLLFWREAEPLAAIAVDHYRTVSNPSFPAIPLFTFAGYLLAESQAPRRLIEVFDALLGKFRGGAVLVTVLACTFFTSFTGASGVTVLALGGLIMPLLLSTGYGERPSLGLVTAAGLPGTILMPALPLILYAIVAGVAINDMFLAGLLPASLMAGIVALWGMRRRPASSPTPRVFDAARVRRALLAARWELSVPLVPIASLASGIATPVESAALTAMYVLFVVTIAHRDLGWRRDVPRVMAECGLIVGGILLVMGVALGLTDYLVDVQVPDRLVDWVRQGIDNRIAFLLVLNAFLLIAGCVVEIYPAIMVLAPIVTHLGAAYGIDPVHLGIIFLANMELGYLTPLVGLNLFFAAYRFNRPIAEVFHAVLPLFVALAIGVLVITYFPALSTALPRAFH